MQTILITGCSSGIGYHCARRLQSLRYKVIATTRKESDVKRLKREGLETYQLDLADSDSISKAVEKITKKHKIDVLFNNAGYGQMGAIEDLKRDHLRKQFETNLFGPIELTNKIIPLMRKEGRGKVIWNSSVLGLVSMPYRGAYNASKFAMEAIVDASRQEFKGTPIHSILIEPGPITSEFRNTAYKIFKKTIDKKSNHKKKYKKMIERLKKKGVTSFFTLSPEAVCGKVIKAIKSKNPKARYYVTLPTFLLAFLRRVLPTRVLDNILNRP